MDVRFLYRPPGPRRWLLKKLYLDWPVARLDVITAISEETKREIVKYTGCDPAKVHVLDLPLTPSGRKPSDKPFDAAEPVILQVGTMDNKNIPNLAIALNGLNSRLRIIDRLSDDQTRILDENNVRYENFLDLNDEQVWDEYENADIVTFCSLYEGFGLPIIEAQSVGPAASATRRERRCSPFRSPLDSKRASSWIRRRAACARRSRTACAWRRGSCLAA